ncbi:MAG: ABC transporter substrate-binding protein [Formosimonas sp.]
MSTFFKTKIAVLISLAAVVGQINAGEIVFNSDSSAPDARKNVTNQVARFEKAHPEIKVKLNIIDHEAYKQQLPNFLSSASPDVVSWYAGERMKYFVDRNLFEDVSDVWAKGGLKDKMGSTLSQMTIKDKQYGVPTGYYQWGMYYRKDVFAKLGLNPPKTWDEFKTVADKLKAAGITPITSGTKEPWPAAGWFDYLNMRINGFDFHMKLTAGEVPYTDEKVKKVFVAWKELLDKEYFLKNHGSYTWQEALTQFNQGKTGMYLMGNFLVGALPKDVEPNVGFFPFPTIDPNIPAAEDAPTDTIHIPVNAKNKADAKVFLEFIASAEEQSAFSNDSKYLPANKDAKVADDRFLKAGFELLSNAKGIAQFYDRDTTREMAEAGMKGFAEFMADTSRMDAVMAKLEESRVRIYKAATVTPTKPAAAESAPTAPSKSRWSWILGGVAIAVGLLLILKRKKN